MRRGGNSAPAANAGGNTGPPPPPPPRQDTVECEDHNERKQSTRGPPPPIPRGPPPPIPKSRATAKAPPPLLPKTTNSISQAKNPQQLKPKNDSNPPTTPNRVRTFKENNSAAQSNTEIHANAPPGLGSLLKNSFRKSQTELPKAATGPPPRPARSTKFSATDYDSTKPSKPPPPKLPIKTSSSVDLALDNSSTSNSASRTISITKQRMSGSDAGVDVLSCVDIGDMMSSSFYDRFCWPSLKIIPHPPKYQHLKKFYTSQGKIVR